jgi:hypothetical protein
MKTKNNKVIFGQGLLNLGLALTALLMLCGLLLVGDKPYGPAEVTAALKTNVAGVVAWDPRTAAVLTGSHGTVRDLRRSPLIRSVATLAGRLAPTPSPEPDPETTTQPVPLIQDQPQEARS